jgi:hypothetical protein
MRIEPDLTTRRGWDTYARQQQLVVGFNLNCLFDGTMQALWLVGHLEAVHWLPQQLNHTAPAPHCSTPHLA